MGSRSGERLLSFSGKQLTEDSFMFGNIINTLVFTLLAPGGVAVVVPWLLLSYGLPGAFDHGPWLCAALVPPDKAS
jgi:hypothetical protein